MSAKLKVAGIDLVSIGAAEGDSEAVSARSAEGVYRKLVVRDGRAAGAVLLGDVRGAEALLAEIRAAEAVEDALALWDARLFFEVHEVLEPHWAVATGDTREALQGVIQIAVGWQHLANGNLAGARALLADGAAKLHGRRLFDVALDAFARHAFEAAERLPDAEPPPFPRAAL
jgi:predicted metal-dependent hydrolase